MISGKFFRSGQETFYLKGVTYGTFAPRSDGSQFPSSERVAGDFALMSARGINAVRLYTPPREDMLEAAERWDLGLMVGLPWTQHVAFLDDAKLTREIRKQVIDEVRRLRDEKAVLLMALGNEIPPPVVRWHGRRKVERFLRELVDEARQAAPEGRFTYVNYPPTEFLDLDCFDVCSFNVYLHDERKLRSYLTRLQHIAGNKPLLLAEAGACSLHEGEDGQAALTAMQIGAAFREGACGVFAYAWTDEWWRGGQDVKDWAFGLVDERRRPKPALAAVTQAFADAPFPAEEKKRWPKVSVVVCAYNAADTLEDCLASLERLNYPDYEVVLVNDGSKDATPAIARAHAGVRTIDVHPNAGLSNARNVGAHAATGAIVAYCDADVRVDPEWLTYLVQPFLNDDVVGSGGPNVVPPDDPWIAQCVARAPGGPTHVLLDDRTAEHVPGCNMAFDRAALLSIGGFNPVFLRAGDDVDVCWRLQAKGWRIGFAPAALVWHHHRASIKAYWRQQIGYGEGELWLAPHHPDKFQGRHVLWRGRIYSALPFVRSLTRARINAGLWGTAAFPSVYFTGAPAASYLPHSVQWQAAWIALIAAGLLGLLSSWPLAAAGAVVAGLAMLATTLVKCFRYAGRSDVAGLGPIEGRSAAESRARYRRTIAWLHFIQPLARLRGLVRGLMNPPSDVPPEVSGTPRRSLARSAGAGFAALRMCAGETLLGRYWGESWTAVETVLHGVVKELRATRAVKAIAVDDGWQHDRDLSVGLGPWARLDLSALVEEHAQGRVLLRVATRLRLTGVGALGLAALSLALAAASALDASRWPVGVLFGALFATTLAAFSFMRLWIATSALSHAVQRTAAVCGMARIPKPASAGARWARRSLLAFRGSAAAVLLGAASVSLGSVVQTALGPLVRPERPAAAAPVRKPPVLVAAPSARRQAPVRPPAKPSAVRTSADARAPQPMAAVLVLPQSR
ncbi:MAG TPA: glycosyltransferase [Vicinamibacteria bacterium]|nr:glycosyltransferase [Vicinamibacteria bacterium]